MTTAKLPLRDQAAEQETQEMPGPGPVRSRGLAEGQAGTGEAENQAQAPIYPQGGRGCIWGQHS